MLKKSDYVLFNTYVYFHLHDFYSLFEYRAKGVSIVWFIRWFLSFIFITFQLFLLFFDAFKVCISIMYHNKSRQQFYKARRMWSKNEWKSNQALWGLGMKYRMRETARWDFNYFSLKKNTYIVRRFKYWELYIRQFVNIRIWIRVFKNRPNTYPFLPQRSPNLPLIYDVGKMR